MQYANVSRRHFLQASALGLAITGVAHAAPSRRKTASKKGCCFVARENSPWLEYTKALKPDWLYTWGSVLPEGLPEDIEFCPMVWGGGKKEKVKARLEKIAALVKKDQVKYLLGFNEPDKKDQSNMTVDQALDLWPLLMDLNVPLVSPSCAHPDREWMLDFMKGVQRRDLRVDYIGAHSYGGLNPQALVRRMEKVARTFRRPVWITEFAVADWKAKTLKQNKHSPQKIARFMQNVIPALNASPYIARYAWFSGQPNHKALGNSALFDTRGNLTPLGRLYAQA
ncbi:Glycosyl hydrolase catalytic core [Rubripirellula obstinata]|uniref:Glycosyl hydrolase catalytic core n=1 Tax=Rubripirellula obstinata TaxID=406547 RepID=A0A5B1CJW8_9BACT|nr:glycosyl hydrolase [Rubripirellula obstinata]KAA1260581.1 Glycosyl hydrolase catalytic core [Rubripirellula obstinata]